MSFWQEKIMIGNLMVPRFIGGPLDGITDAPFRQLVRTFSRVELLYTEMRHVSCLAHDNAKERALNFDSSERPLNFQVAANSTRFIAPAVENILNKGVDALDLNVGCPARNVVGSGGGSALMGNLPLLESILKEFRRLLPIPFTVKIRAGFKEKNAVEVAQLVEACGADALAVHPRLQTQHFEGQPDYSLVAAVKKSVRIPVIVSGGVVNWKMAQLVYEQTGADGYLIGRGLWARPWKLRELSEHAQGLPFQLTNDEIILCALQHLEATLAYNGQRGVYAFRKNLPFYLRGIQGGSAIRQRLITMTDAADVRHGLQALLTAPPVLSGELQSALLSP